MKNTRFLFLLLVLAVVAAVWWYDHGPLTLQGEIDRFVRQEALMSGSIAIASQGQISATFHAGAPDSESVDARRPIASLSKLLTAQTVALLVHDGVLQLSDRLSDQLPELPYANDAGYREITVQHLLQHTAGFDRSQSGDPLFEDALTVRGCDAAVQIAVARPLDYPPNQVTKYSNIGYCLLGMLIERVTGQSYEAAVIQRLLPHHEGDPLVLGRPAGVTPQKDAIFSSAALRSLGAAGGWFTDAETLAQLLGQDRGRDLALHPLRAELGHEFYYGQGWRVWATPYRRWTHYGAVPGIYAFAMQLPNTRIVVALFKGRPSSDESAATKLIDIFENRNL